METRQLFGGACEIAIPTGFVDISQFREVPDNQEVFANKVDDDSIMIEFLEMAEVGDEASASFHFGAIAESNDVAPQDSVIEVDQAGALPPSFLNAQGATCQLLRGYQNVAKFNEGVKNRVQIMLAVVRLPHVQTDLVISWNHPVSVNPQSSSAGTAATTTGDLSHEFLSMLKSFCMVNWALFGDDEEDDS